MQAFVAFLSVLLIAFASGAEDFKAIAAKRDAHLKECQSELSVPDEVAQIVNQKKEATTEQERCVLECFYGKLHLIKDGKLSHEGSDALAKARFGENAELIKKSHDIFEKCQSSYTPSNEKCALGKHIRNCFIQNDSEQLNFFPTTPTKQ